MPGADGQSVDVSPHADTRSFDISVACERACLLLFRSHSFSRSSDFSFPFFVCVQNLLDELTGAGSGAASGSSDKPKDEANKKEGDKK